MSKVNCRSARAKLCAYIDEQLPAEHRAEIEGHLAGCAACAEELRRLRDSCALIRGLDRHAPPAGSWAAILRGVGSATQQTPHRRAWAPAAGLVVVMAGIALFVASQLWGPPPPRVAPFTTAHGGGTGTAPADPIPTPVNPASLNATWFVDEHSSTTMLPHTTLPGLPRTETARNFAKDEAAWLTQPAPQFLRGVAIDSMAVGQTASVDELVAYAQRAHLNLVVVDFNWVTYYWYRTKLSAVNELARRLGEAGIEVYAMYRPGRLGLKDHSHLPPQVDRDGKEDERNICFSYPEARQWVVAWGQQIFNNVRPLQGLLLHQPSFAPDACYCPVCREQFRWDTGKEIGDDEAAWLEWRAKVITNFVRGWAEEMKRTSPPLMVGVVVSAPPAAQSFGQDLDALSEHIDILSPVIAINPTAKDKEIDPDLVRSAGDLLQPYRGRVRLLADLRVYFGESTYNSTDDVVNAIVGTRAGFDGFFLWGFDLFGSPSRYDRERVADAIRELSPAIKVIGEPGLSSD
ncbi:hypothetical protein AMK68_01190 [candidate division KD3-62 bacterium DG_56]|uniref:Putative zinc-finger domain-containing protein n=1 Tax=candidate division KD3-62 bacterium DG_56 TaxID=1704032 RepID=A0A0S7XQ95_9BACT|nr:MAG: hypothetical protein AMK68_01190 [candidate division KD3-62 bacterium DG_56]